MLKEVPRFVSKGQHSKRGTLVSELLGRWTREILGAGGVPWVPGWLPYGPCLFFPAGRRLRTPRGVAPWRAAPGRVAAAHRRVPAGLSTIPARRESPSRLGRPAPAARRPLPQGAGGGAPAPSPKQSLLVQPRSARGRSARARASRRLLELRGDPPATHSAPPSRPSVPLSSPRAPRLPLLQSAPEGQAPSSPPSAAASRRLARDQEELASGVPGAPGP